MKWFNSDAIIPAGLAFFAGMGWAYFTVVGEPFYGSVDWVAFGSVITAMVFLLTAYNIVYLPWRNRNYVCRTFISELLISASVIEESLADYNEGKMPAPHVLLSGSYEAFKPFIGSLGEDTLAFADLCKQVLRTESNWRSIVDDITREAALKGKDYKGSPAHVHYQQELKRTMDGLATARTNMRRMAKKLSQNPHWRAN